MIHQIPKQISTNALHITQTPHRFKEIARVSNCIEREELLKKEERCRLGKPSELVKTALVMNFRHRQAKNRFEMGYHLIGKALFVKSTRHLLILHAHFLEFIDKLF